MYEVKHLYMNNNSEFCYILMRFKRQEKRITGLEHNILSYCLTALGTINLKAFNIFSYRKSNRLRLRITRTGDVNILKSQIFYLASFHPEVN